MSLGHPPVARPACRWRALVALAGLLALGACADIQTARNHANPGPYGPRPLSEADALLARVGTVESIEVVRIHHTAPGASVPAGTQTSDAFRITVRMHDGSTQALTQTTGAQLQVGDRVQVANGVAQPY